MVSTLGRLMDAFWRAAGYCLHPRVIGLSLLPLLLCGILAAVFGYFGWEGTVAWMRATLESWQLVESLLSWLDHMGLTGFRAVMAPMLVLALLVPAVLVLSLLSVALMMTPAMVNLVAERRFMGLEKKRGASFVMSALWSIGHTLAALGMLVVSMPFWLIPPLVLLVPPLIWGWLGYRVFAYDVLADHASVEERQQILRQHRAPLMGLGLITGYLGAAPAAIWAFGVMSIALAPFLLLVSVWLYTLVFAFSSLWFAHYALAALHELRRERGAATEVIDLPSVERIAATPAGDEARPPSLPWA